MRKKYLLIAVIATLLGFVSGLAFVGESAADDEWDGTVDTSWYEDNPNASEYKLTKASELAGLAELVNRTSDSVSFAGKTVTLENNLNLAKIEWMPIGATTSFAGIFNGGGHTISNMTITGDVEYAGLFGQIGPSDAIVENVKLINLDINVNVTCRAGGIAANNFGTVSNCTLSGKISASTAGGVVGWNQNAGTVSYCTSSVNISSSANDSSTDAGGVVGVNNGGTVSYCTSSGNVSSSTSASDASAFAGGIAGENAGTVSNCASSGNVSSSNSASSYYAISYAGGVVGNNRGIVSDCRSSGNISASSSSWVESNYTGACAGGIVGCMDAFRTVKNSDKLSGTVSAVNTGGGGAYAGGVIGAITDARTNTISDNTFSMAATGQQWGIGDDGRQGNGGPSNNGAVPIDGMDNSRYPIVFVPGIMGSDLYETPACNIWDLAWPSFPFRSDMSVFPYYVHSPEDLNSPASIKYYGVMETAKDLLTAICAEFPDREVYFFSYDWRLSCEENVNYLNDFISTKTKVDIVSHSMGGLITSFVYKNNPGKINKVITIATPYEGSVEAIKRATDPFAVIDIPVFDQVLTLFGGIYPWVKRSYRSMAEITPTENYIASPSHAMTNNNGVPFSYAEYGNRLSGIFSSDNFPKAKDFQDSLLSGKSNALLGYGNAYFVVASGQPTIKSLSMGLISDLVGIYSDIRYGDGDGTVPTISATMMNNLPSSRSLVVPDKHTSVLKNAEVIQFVKNVLKGNPSAQTPQDYGKSNTVIRVACPVDVTISWNGETLTSVPDELNEFTSFGRLDLIGEDGDIKMLCVEEGALPVMLQGTGSGTMNYTIRFFDKDENLIKEHAFEDIVITDKTFITTDTGRTGPTILYVDEDGDGIVDYVLSSDDNGGDNGGDGGSGSSHPSNDNGVIGCSAGLGVLGILILAGLIALNRRRS